MSLVRILAATALLAGCQQVEDDISRTRQASLTTNGVALNGTSLNGDGLLAVYPNGLSFNGEIFNGLSFNGLSFNGLSFNGSELIGTTENGLSFNGNDFVGATADAAVTESGEVVTIRIDDVRRSRGLHFYTISYEDGEQEVCTGKNRRRTCTVETRWTPICGTDSSGAPIESLLLEGRWDSPELGGNGAHIDDSNAITIACREAALAKCVELGYEPWNGLADHHQACTRLIRADYCGDGVSHTVNGWVVNVYDNDGVQEDAVPDGYSGYWDDALYAYINYVFEAQWTPNGAACLDEERVQGLFHGSGSSTEFTLPCAVPVTTTCSDRTSPLPGTLLFNETQVRNYY